MNMPEIKSMAMLLSGSFSSWLEATACDLPQIVADSDSGHEQGGQREGANTSLQNTTVSVVMRLHLYPNKPQHIPR